MRVDPRHVDLTRAASLALVSVSEAQEFARAPALEDGQWASFIASAAQQAQEWTLRQFLHAGYRARLPRFPPPGVALELLPAPLVAVTGIEYVDAQGVARTLAPEAYSVIRPTGPSAAPGAVWAERWPASAARPDAVLVSFDAGYGATAEEVFAVVPGLRLALLKGAAEVYARREASEVLRAMLGELEPLRAAP